MSKTAEIIFSGDTTKLRSAVVSASSDLKTFGKDAEESSSKFSKVKAAAVGAVTGGIGVLTAGLTEAFKAANAEQQATVRLNQSFKDAGVSIAPYKAQIDAAEASGRNLGFTNEQVQQSLGSLVTATHSGADSLKYLGTVEDLARFKHTSLEAATKMITAAMGGSSRAAKQLGINIQPVTTNVDALKAKYAALKQPVDAAALAQAKLADKNLTAKLTIEAVSKAVHGQADAYAGTAAGAMARYHAQIDNIQQAFGKVLLPIMVKVIGAISSMVGWMEKHKAVAIVLGVVIGGLAGAIGAVAVAETVAGGVTGVWTAAQWLLNTALDANPIALVVVAIAALVAGIVFLVTKTHVVSDLWKAVQGVFTDAGKIISNVLGDLLSVGKDILGVFTGLGSAVTNAIGDVLGAIGNIGSTFAGIGKSILDAITSSISSVGSGFASAGASILSAITGGFGDIGKGIADAISGAINGLVSGGGKVLSAAEHIGSTLVTHVLSGIGNLASKLGSVVGKAMSGLGKYFFSSNIGNDIKHVFEGIPGLILNLLLPKNMKKSIDSAFHDILTTFKGWATDVGKFFVGLWSNYIEKPVSWIANKIAGVFKSVVGDVSNLGKGIGEAVASGIKAVLNGVIDFINTNVIGAINGFIKFWNHIHVHVNLPDPFPNIDFGLPHIDTLNGIPALADGGYITRAGMALVGERGPELLSLPTGAQVTPLGKGHVHIDMRGARINSPHSARALADRLEYRLKYG